MMVVSDGLTTNKDLTPAHTYAYEGDFNVLLEAIANGKIPCGSGRVFPVEFADPNDDLSKMNTGWDSPSTTYTGGNVLGKFFGGVLG